MDLGGEYMINNTLSLHYLDKNWQKRGYANHIHLIIDFDAKVYRKLVNFGLPNFDRQNIIEVVRKSDIDDYVEHLKAFGFTETKEEIVR